MKKVAVALSGGVDSSVSALLLKQQGYDVVGVTLKLSSVDSCSTDIQVCCSTKDILDARRVASYLGIPHYVIDWQELFKQKVIDYFVNKYLQGQTPNPCAICNRDIKTGLLAAYVRQVLKADYLATGHYIKTSTIDGIKVLLRGSDRNKDQSYFLSLVDRQAVDMLVFPVGDLTKEEVRQIARQEGIPVSQKRESFEICFTAGKEPYIYLLENGVEMQQGQIAHVSGKVVGKHKGLAAYTIGQRRGLSVHWREPLYVVDKDPQKNLLIVGEKQHLLTTRVEADSLNILVPVETWKNISVQGRYRQQPVAADSFLIEDGKIEVHFSQPQQKFAPGQILAIYMDDVLVGGGVITKS